MRVLDVDLDFFLSKRRTWTQETSRPNAQEFVPWKPALVREFFEKQCGLRQRDPLPATLVTTHDQVYDAWVDQVHHGTLRAPFEVVHVDAHADLGMGDASHVYILGELLHLPVSQRMNPERGGHAGLGEGNYLAFAIACRFLSSLTYVHPLGMANDLPHLLYREHRTDTDTIELACYEAETAGRLSMIRAPVPLRVEPPVPVAVVPVDEYRNHAPFDYAYLSISPRYTPVEAEELVPVIGDYLRFA